MRFAPSALVVVRTTGGLLFATLFCILIGCGPQAGSAFPVAGLEDESTSEELSASTEAEAPATTSEKADRQADETTSPPDDSVTESDSVDEEPAEPPDEEPVEEETSFDISPGTHAMWLWDDSPRADSLLMNEDGARDELFSFLAAPHGDSERAVDRLFFESRRKFIADRNSELLQVVWDPLAPGNAADALHAFLKKAHEQGIAVEYLDGQALWIATDAYAEVPKKICEDVVAFNRSTDDVAERFDGVHLDIEPHTVTSGPFAGQWWEDRLPGGYNRTWTARWQDILTSCRQTLDNYAAMTGHEMTLSLDLGADFGHYNGPMREFIEAPDGPVDYVTLMNYYDNRPNRDGEPSFFKGEFDGNAVTGGVDRNLSDWTRIPLLFGLETGPTSIARDEHSFHQEGLTAMNTVIDTLEASYDTPRNLGAAVHHYSSYRALE